MKTLSSRLNRSTSKVIDYDFEIKYKPETVIGIPDSLSRYPGN